MQKLLNIFPMPNAPNVLNGGALSPTGAWYNYTIQDFLTRPGRQNSLRVDYNISTNWKFYFRLIQNSRDSLQSGGLNINNASAIGSGTLNSSGQAMFTTSTLTVGSHAITASYGGDTTFKEGTSPKFTQTVNP